MKHMNFVDFVFGLGNKNYKGEKMKEWKKILIGILIGLCISRFAIWYDKQHEIPNIKESIQASEEKITTK